MEVAKSGRKYQTMWEEEIGQVKQEVAKSGRLEQAMYNFIKWNFNWKKVFQDKEFYECTT